MIFPKSRFGWVWLHI